MVADGGWCLVVYTRERGDERITRWCEYECSGRTTDGLLHAAVAGQAGPALVQPYQNHWLGAFEST